jgi:hypothetical protein
MVLVLGDTKLLLLLECCTEEAVAVDVAEHSRTGADADADRQLLDDDYCKVVVVVVDDGGVDYYFGRRIAMLPCCDGHLPFADVAVASTDLLLEYYSLVLVVVSSWDDDDEEEEDSRDLVLVAEEEVAAAAVAAAVQPRWNRHPARLGKDSAHFHPP